jgi:hypothetical protein
MKRLALAAIIACTREPAAVVPEIANETKQAPARVSADPVLERMARARDLAIVHDVKRADVDRAGLIARLEAHVAREVPREEIRAEDAFLKALGVIGSDVDYEREVYAALRDGAAGMYEPFDQTMYVASDLPPSTRETTVAHESVHALQDQHFDLRAFQGYLRGQTDTMLARSCLVEGDATEATGERPSKHEHDSDRLDDDYIGRELAAPYTFGSAFVRALREKGGWAEVDRAWKTALATEQILHPEKWIAGERAESVPVPTFATLGGAFRDPFVDVKGELSLRLVLESFVGEERAAEGAAGWAGDTAVLVRDGQNTMTHAALAWRIRWDDDASAARGFAVLTEAFHHRMELSVTHAGRDALVLVGPADRLARWSKEILR